ncbi:hypothetical protein PR048_019008 [Dryococelus australis]|uniref:C2H2-type domain-containing protein n=1 Tax=Dryococelus australis TaxID=614101 RepID=A0ABQ9H2A2_9NEOP|nr:hypothetical protein PR048_019008 [Dryococelus australis]
MELFMLYHSGPPAAILSAMLVFGIDPVHLIAWERMELSCVDSGKSPQIRRSREVILHGCRTQEQLCCSSLAAHPLVDLNKLVLCGQQQPKWTSNWNSPGFAASRPLLADVALQVPDITSLVRSRFSEHCQPERAGVGKVYNGNKFDSQHSFSSDAGGDRSLSHPSSFSILTDRVTYKSVKCGMAFARRDSLQRHAKTYVASGPSPANIRREQSPSRQRTSALPTKPRVEDEHPPTCQPPSRPRIVAGSGSVNDNGFVEAHDCIPSQCEDLCSHNERGYSKDICTRLARCRCGAPLFKEEGDCKVMYVAPRVHSIRDAAEYRVHAVEEALQHDVSCHCLSRAAVGKQAAGSRQEAALVSSSVELEPGRLVRARRGRTNSGSIPRGGGVTARSVGAQQLSVQRYTSAKPSWNSFAVPQRRRADIGRTRAPSLVPANREEEGTGISEQLRLIKGDETGFQTNLSSRASQGETIVTRSRVSPTRHQLSQHDTRVLHEQIFINDASGNPARSAIDDSGGLAVYCCGVSEPLIVTRVNLATHSAGNQDSGDCDKLRQQDAVGTSASGRPLKNGHEQSVPGTSAADTSRRRSRQQQVLRNIRAARKNAQLSIRRLMLSGRGDVAISPFARRSPTGKLFRRQLWREQQSVDCRGCGSASLGPSSASVATVDRLAWAWRFFSPPVPVIIYIVSPDEMSAHCDKQEMVRRREGRGQGLEPDDNYKGISREGDPTPTWSVRGGFTLSVIRYGSEDLAPPPSSASPPPFIPSRPDVALDCPFSPLRSSQEDPPPLPRRFIYLPLQHRFPGMVTDRDPNTFDTVPAVYPFDTVPAVYPFDTVPAAYPFDTVPAVYPFDTVPAAYPFDTVPAVYPFDTVPAAYPFDTVPAVYPFDTVPAVYPFDTVPAAYPFDTVPAIYPFDTVHAVYPFDTVPAAYPFDTVPAAYPFDTVPAVYPFDTVPAAYPLD